MLSLLGERLWLDRGSEQHLHPEPWRRRTHKLGNTEHLHLLSGQMQFGYLVIVYVIIMTYMGRKY